MTTDAGTRDEAGTLRVAGRTDAPVPVRPAVLPYATGVAEPAYDADAHDCAVASVLCALLFFCAPFLTGIMSLIFGISVLRHAQRLPKADLVTAIIGTVLGVLNLGFWTFWAVIVSR